MTKDLIEQVKEIEAEADRIVAEARQRASQIEESVKDEVAALRKERADAFAGDMKAFQAELDRQTADERAQIDEKARQIAARLESLDPEAVAKAIDFVLKRLCEG